MKKVDVKFGYSVVLDDDKIEKGIDIYECNDIVVSNVEKETIVNLLEKYNNDDEIEYFTELLEDNDLYWSYLGDGYYTEEEVLEKYKNDVFVNVKLNEVLDAKEYYDWYPEVCFYTYWDGSNWQTLDLENEGEDVIHLTTLKEGNDYEINLYYNVEEKELFTVYNSYYQGALMRVESYCDIEEDIKPVIENIENLLEKINNEIENNNKYIDKFEGFKIVININDEEFELFEYISDLYDWYEKDDNKLYIISKYK